MIPPHVKNAFDKLEKQPEKGATEGLSPMDPPDAYAPPAREDVPLEELDPFLRSLVEEHAAIREALAKFEAVLGGIENGGVGRETNAALSEFFRFFDEKLLPHQRREERKLFSILDRRLVAAGEHSAGPEKDTVVDVLEGDHLQAAQVAATVFNLFGLAGRLPDHASRLIVLDLAVQQSRELVEQIRLHVFREESIVFPLAHRHLQCGDFAAIAAD